MAKFIQLNLFEDFDDKSQSPCVGCGARRYDEGRFYKLLKCCIYCALDHSLMRASLCRDRPIDNKISKHAPRSKERIALYADRYKRGVDMFHPEDAFNGVMESPAKRRGEEGETGVERAGDRWRARTFWRGRKWLLGTFDHEEEAISRCREWWKIHKGVDMKPPAVWMPCGDDDRSFAIEHEHIAMWKVEFPLVDSLAIATNFMMQLRKVRQKPGQVEVWNELVRRLARSQKRKSRVPAMVGDNQSVVSDDDAGGVTDNV